MGCTQSNDSYDGEPINHMSIDDATVGDVSQKLNDVLKGLKNGETKTLSQDEIKKLFQH